VKKTNVNQVKAAYRQSNPASKRGEKPDRRHESAVPHNDCNLLRMYKDKVSASASSGHSRDFGRRGSISPRDRNFLADGDALIMKTEQLAQSDACQRNFRV
jgi:hypothetical protein